MRRSSRIGCIALLAMTLGINGCSQVPEFSRVAGPSAALNYLVQRQHHILVVGDSTTAGTTFGGHGYTNWVNVVATDLAAEGRSAAFARVASGGSGYLTPSIDDGATFFSGVRRKAGPDTDLIVAFGSNNDMETPGDLRDAVRRVIELAQQRSPRTAIILVAPIWIRSPQPPASHDRMTRILATVAEEYDLEYHDPTQERWLADTSRYLGEDGIHPNDEGHRILANRMGDVIGRRLDRLEADQA